MFTWFIQWTTELNQFNHVGFAAVTVLTMAGIGIGLAGTAELILRQLAGKSGAPKHHHPSGH